MIEEVKGKAERLLSEGSMMSWSREQLERMLGLPDHLRRTYQAILELGGKAFSWEVAEKTRRTRAHESMLLNQLVVIGYLTKRRQGRRVVFESV